MAVTMKSGASVEVVKFGAGSDAKPQSKEILGGKGANLVEMASLGFPVPPGFVIPCSASIAYMNASSSLSQSLFLKALWAQVADGLVFLKDAFGYLPLVSVRSGARVSMPGMMDTILNVGLTTENLQEWGEKLGERAALDSYRRLLQMYGSVVFEIPMPLFDDALAEVKHSAGVASDSDLTVDDLHALIAEYERIFAEAGHQMPDTVSDQVHGAVKAVFRSWNNPRAIEYRKIHGYPDDWGTAVTVQSMVFGNLNNKSATGVLFTRCPSTGSNGIVGEFLVNAQGEDVVAGIRTPEPLMKMSEWNSEAHTILCDTVCKLEKHYRDMQDVEFTIQSGELFILQTRSGKRSALAAFNVAHDLAEEGLITQEEALGRVTQKQLLALMQDTVDPDFKTAPHMVGIAAGGGLVTGKAVFTSEAAINCNEPCILVRKETDPDDIGGMNASVGILTATGGLTSHAAVVARGMNKTCVVGCTMMEWQESPPKAVIKHQNSLNNYQFVEGAKITMDGHTGRVWVGIDVPVVSGGMTEEVKRVLSWATAGASERITLTNDNEGEWIPLLGAVSSKSVFVDTALIEPDLNTQVDGYGTALLRLVAAMSACQAEEIVLDLALKQSYWDDDDRLMDHMMGSGVSPSAALAAKVKGLMSFPVELRPKIVVSMPVSVPELSTMLIGSGYSLSVPITTVSDLLASSGAVRVTPEVIKTVFGGQKAFDTLCVMVEAQTGKKLSGGAPVYWYDALNKVV